MRSNDTAMTVAAQGSLADQIRRHLFYSQAKSPTLANQHDHYMALSVAVTCGFALLSFLAARALVSRPLEAGLA